MIRSIGIKMLKFVNNVIANMESPITNRSQEDNGNIYNNVFKTE
jgi:hypothetical protein